MQTFISLGRWIFPIPFAVIGMMYLMDVPATALRIVPAYMPLKELWVYLSSACLIVAAVSMYIGKYDKLATTLVAIFLLLVLVLVHMPLAMGGGEKGQYALNDLFQDMGLMAAALIYAECLARDKAVIG